MNFHVINYYMRTITKSILCSENKNIKEII